jgi:hypothetical protein
VQANKEVNFFPPPGHIGALRGGWRGQASLKTFKAHPPKKKPYKTLYYYIDK